MLMFMRVLVDCWRRDPTNGSTPKLTLTLFLRRYLASSLDCLLPARVVMRGLTGGAPSTSMVVVVGFRLGEVWWEVLAGTITEMVWASYNDPLTEPPPPTDLLPPPPKAEGM